MATTTTVTSTGYGTTTSTTTTTVLPDIYNDRGCNGGPGACAGYNAVAKCIVDLYAGVDACQELYILDSDGNPVDIHRIDKIDIALRNEFDCIVMSTDNGGISISNEQSTYYGKLFSLTPDNFWSKDRLYFETFNVRVHDDDPSFVCPDDEKAIAIGIPETDGGCAAAGHITFNPLYYKGDLIIELTANKHNTGSCICTLNGLPQNLRFGETNRIVNVLSGCEESILTIMSYDAEYNPTVALLDSIDFSCSSGYRNQGLLKICYDGSKIPEITGNLTAEIILKFNEYDRTDPGAVKVISCVPLANVKKSYIVYEHHDDEQDEKEYVVGGVIYKYVKSLPQPGWNSMNVIYLIKSPNERDENMYEEYITVKVNNNGVYSYHWEKLGDTNYDINVKQQDEKSVNIVLTDNEADTDMILLKHQDRENGHGSMIEFDADGDNTIIARVTHIDGGVL